jgi:hypothetical protein
LPILSDENPLKRTHQPFFTVQNEYLSQVRSKVCTSTTSTDLGRHESMCYSMREWKCHTKHHRLCTTQRLAGSQ